MAGLNPKVLIRKKARKYPIHDCLITNEGAEGGKYNITIARQKPNGNLIVGFYMIDMWCMGLKDTFYRHDMEIDEFEDIVYRMKHQGFEEISVEKCEPNHAFNLIYGAIEYAEDLGFQPPKDFQITEYILADVDEVEYEEIEFGKDGKPFYLSGPDDNVQAVITKLEKAVGTGNFHYFTHFPDNDEYELHNWKEEHLPDEEVSEKLHYLPEAFKTDFMLQIMICGFIGEELEGRYEELAEYYDEDFQESILDSLENAMKEMREMEGQPINDEDFSAGFFIPAIQYTAGRIIEEGSPAWLFDKDYKPFMLSHLPETLDQMTEEEMMAFNTIVIKGMTPSELFTVGAKSLATDLIYDKYDGRLSDKSTEEKFREEALPMLKEEVVKSMDINPFENDEEMETFFKEIIDEVIETQLRFQD